MSFMGVFVWDVKWNTPDWIEFSLLYGVRVSGRGIETEKWHSQCISI